MTGEQQWDRARELLSSTSAGSRWWGFNGGGSASDTAKNYLRALLRQHTSNTDAEAIRHYFNEQRRTGDRIQAQDVAAAIEFLKTLA